MRKIFSLVFIAIVAAGPAQAQFGLFLRDLTLTDEDWTLFRKALGEALTPGAPGSRSEWSNPATSLKGDIVVERAFETDGAPCRDVRMQFIGSKVQSYRLAFCRTERGEWAIAP